MTRQEPTPRITLLIPCLNERDGIVDCIESARAIADEMVVADSGSTDGTLELARSLPGVRVVEREYRNPADFKNWAVDQCRGDWVLTLDADERVTPELIDAVRAEFAAGPRFEAYRVPFDTYLFGQRLRGTSWGRDCVLRLFRRGPYRYRDSHRVHESIDVSSERVGVLGGTITHDPIRSFRHWIDKTNRYTEWAAQDAVAAGKRPNWSRVTLRPLAAFLREYLWLGGFRDGLRGFYVAAFAGYYTLLKGAKLWELAQAPQAKAPSPQAAAPSPEQETEDAAADRVA